MGGDKRRVFFLLNDAAQAGNTHIDTVNLNLVQNLKQGSITGQNQTNGK